MPIYSQKGCQTETRALSSIEDSWRIKATSPRTTPGLWTGPTIFKFSDKPLTAGQIFHSQASRQATEPRVTLALALRHIHTTLKTRRDKVTLPLALRHIHTTLKIRRAKELHLQPRHMSGEQVRFRTGALHLPKEIYDPCGKTRSQCEPCQKAAIAQSRSKTSGLRTETFGESSMF